MSVNATVLSQPEYDIRELPLDLQLAIRIAADHDKRVILGYVEDEGKVYLATVDNEDIDL